VTDDNWANDALDIDRPTSAERRAAREEKRHGAARADPHDRRRWPVVALVVLALVLAGVSGGIKASGAGSVPMSSNVIASSVLPVVGPASASSSAWYCPGPLPLGPKGGSSVEIANTGQTAVTAALTIAILPGAPRSAAPLALRWSPTGSARTVRLTVPPLSTFDYALPAAVAGSRAAVTVLTNGGGIAVAEGSSSQGVRTTASCQVVPGGSWLLASGSTAHAADTFVSILDPTSLPAVVNVSCAVPALPGTQTQAITPPPLQGLTLQPGQLLLVDLGRIVQLKPNLAVTATTTSGRVVVGEWTQTAVGPTYYGRLQSAVSSGLGTWSFPLASSPPGVMPVYWLYNPSTKESRVQVAIAVGSKSLTTQQLSVLPASLAVVSPGIVSEPAVASAPGKARRTPPGFALITTLSGTPVVAARGYIVRAATPPVRKTHHGKRSHSGSRPGTLAVYAPWTMLGTGDAHDHWLVFVPPALPSPAVGTARHLRKKGKSGRSLFHEALYLANSGTGIAHVTLEFLPGAGSLASSSAGRVRTARVAVQPGTTLRLGIPPTAAASSVLVAASPAVTVELDLYAPKLPSGDAAAGIPVA
jgi:hypothetical protein